MSENDDLTMRLSVKLRLGVMFADIIQNQNGKSAGFGSVEFKTKEEMEEIAKKLDGHEVSGRALKCCPDINAEQLVRMCNKQGLDPGRSGMAAMGNRMGGPQGRGGPPHGRYGGGGGMGRIVIVYD